MAHRVPRKFGLWTAFAVIAGMVFVGLLALPMLSLLIRIPPGELIARLRNPLIIQALRLSLVTSIASTAAVLVLGLPLAYLLAMRAFPGKRLLEVLIDLPMVLPPTVAGVGLLLAFGRMGLAGRGDHDPVHDARRRAGADVRGGTLPDQRGARGV